MRICRLRYQGDETAGFFNEQRIVKIGDAADAFAEATSQRLELPNSSNLLDYLPPDGPAHAAASTLHDWMQQEGADRISAVTISPDDVELLVPIPRPNKLFLLAGNYAKHIEEGGGIAAERAETFPYVFMKPPTTTLTNPGAAIGIPKISPMHIDWELELAVVIGRRTKGISERDALECVAGYTIINDISDRRFRPNKNRKQRDKDSFFDWLHGKWHDSFCPCGPCITSAATINDPQQLELKLRLNGELRQDSSTANQIFPVAAVIEFLASFVTLEPGDMISTGTPDGVGNSSGTYLQPGDVLEASISEIGTLHSTVVAADG